MSIEVAPDARDQNGLIGEVLASRYRIEVIIGEGAMGAVYKAKHVKVGRPFAVKVLHKKLLEDKKVLQRFEREAELAGRLRHPNVVGVVDVGETPLGDRYMVMDFAHGHDLATMLGEAPMPPERVINLTRQMLEGLYHAHEAGLIHRDFKPENVIVERNDHDVEVPRIVDFGIAILREGGDSTNAAGRLTTNGLVLGTPHYMAPEQAVADPIDHRIDLFALGIVIYEMLCGKLPFDGTGAEVARANLLLDPPPIVERVPYLEVDPLLEAYARRLMAKKREHRPATAKVARELLDLIVNDREAAAKQLGVPLSQSSRQPAITQPVTPHRGAVNEESGDHAMPGAPVIVETTVPSRADELEAPPVSAAGTPAPIATRKPNRQREITTDVSDPLVYGAPSRRRTWIVGAIAGFSVAAAATVAAIKLGGSSDQPADPPQVTQASSFDDPKPADPVKPVDTVKPDDTRPAVVPDEVKPDEVKPDEVKPDEVKPNPGTAQKKTVTPRKKPPVVAVKPDTKPDVTPDPKPDTKPTKAVAPTVAELEALYGAVGNDLKAVTAARGEAATAAISNEFRVFKLHKLVGTEADRSTAATILNRLRYRLAQVMKQK